jgi:regulator-associated protein of mTOR
VLGESSGFGTPNNVGSRSWKRSEDGNVYVQCVTAVYALARDPFPRVACLGRQVLRIMGVESAQIMLATKAGANRSVGHQRNSSVPALPPTPSIAGILHRSTSWVASTSGGHTLDMVTLIGLSLATRSLFAFSPAENWSCSAVCVCQ